MGNYFTIQHVVYIAVFFPGNIIRFVLKNYLDLTRALAMTWSNMDFKTIMWAQFTDQNKSEGTRLYKLTSRFATFDPYL